MHGIEIDRTDEEREELVKKWISDYWLTIVVIVLLAMGALYGLKYYRQSKQDALHAAGAELVAVEKALSTKQLKTAVTKTTMLQQTEKDSSFPVVASLSLAQRYYQEKNYNAAIEQYDWLIQNAGDSAIRDIARLRKARAQADANEINQAVSTLSTVEGQRFTTEGNLLKGDILLADGQFEAAKQAYETLKSAAALDPNILQQRLDLIQIKQQSQ
ncbi:MAG: hypothetical protein CSA44_00190 [Gammaproteobacteria bacterium]|nr:MAG: hypothetical protein CSA44_00190 [Gammaproteobacteria bacterium]